MILDKKTIDILFVEDKTEQIDVLKGIQSDLEQKYGIKITVAKTFRDYEQATKEKEFDVTLTDLFIPYSSGEESKAKSIALWKDIFDEIRSGIKSKDGSVKKAYCGSSSMTGIRTYFRDDEVAKWVRMHAGDTIGKYFDGKKIDDLVLDTIRKSRRYGSDKKSDSDIKVSDYTGPFGTQIFLEEYFKKGHTVKMMTSDHCHGSEGSVFMMYLQHKGLAEFGKLPFVYLDESRDLRLTADARKPGTPEKIEDMIIDGLFAYKIKESKASDDDFIAVDEARKFLKGYGISVKDVYTGTHKEDITQDSIQKKQLQSLQKSIDHCKLEIEQSPQYKWYKSDLEKYSKEKMDLESGIISIYYELDKEQAEYVERGIELISKIFYQK